MAIHVGMGFSQEVDPQKAAHVAAFAAKTMVRTNRIDAALVFSTIHYDPTQIIPVLAKILPGTKIVGSSTAGIIFSHTIHTNGIGVLVISGDEVPIGVGAITQLSQTDKHTAAVHLAQNTLTDFGQHNRHIFLFFADGQMKDSAGMLKGLQDVLGTIFPIVGAGSCDDFHFQKTFQICNNHALTDAATGIMIGGHATVSTAGRHGWRPLGKPRVIDNATGNIIHTINGQKASQLYKDFFQNEFEHLFSSRMGQTAILYPLGMVVPGSHEYLLRNAIDILDDGSIVCQGDVPIGAEVHIMLGNKQSCVQSAKEAAFEAQQGLMGKQPSALIVIESMTRLKLLGRSATQELMAIKEIFGPHVPIFGMYAHGEIFPFQQLGTIKKPHVQNESIVIVALS